LYLGDGTKKPYFKCFGCIGGGLETLLHLANASAGHVRNDLARYLRADDFEEPRRGGKRKKLEENAALSMFDVGLSADEYSEFHKEVEGVDPDIIFQRLRAMGAVLYTRSNPAAKWAVARGFSPDVLVQTNTYFTERLVLFPVIGRNGLLYGLFARAIDCKKFWRITPEKLKLDCVYDLGGHWYGEDVEEDGPLLIVEGALDRLRLMSLGVLNVRAAMGQMSYSQIQSLFSPVIYTGFDDDKAGRAETRRLVAGLKGKSLLYIIDWGVVKAGDPGDLRSSEDAKTAMSKAQLMNVLPKF
jgi:hypothetical protein